MLQTRCTALRLASKKILKKPQRRFESGTGHSESAGHTGPPHHSHHPEPVNEGFGRRFYITLAAIPLSFAIYKFSLRNTSEDSPPLLTRIIKSYNHWGERWTERNTLHTRMVEQAAEDRNLFQSTQGTRMVDLKFPEVFNTGSPFNIEAGQTADLSVLMAHYAKKNKEDEEKMIAKRKARLEEGYSTRR